MTAHLGLDALADLLVGEGSDADVAHLEGCAACSGRLAELDDAQGPVAQALAAEAARPLPPPPADLEERLLARLGDVEAVPDAPARASAAGDVLPSGAVPLRPRAATGRDRSWLLQAAAGAVGLLVVVGLGVGLVRGTGGSDESASGAAAETSALPDLPTSSTGTDYRRDGRALAAALPGLLGSSSRTAAGGGAPAPAAGSEDTALSQAAPVDPLARLRDPAELAGCLAELSGPDSDGVPLALDYAAFEGQPALLVVLPSAREGKVDVFAVGAGCRAGDDQTLFFTRLDRP